MTEDLREIIWRLRLQAPPHKVFALLATDEGRASFWAERTVQDGEDLQFHFPDGQFLHGGVFAVCPPQTISFRYFDDSTVTFELRATGTGTDLCLRESGVTAHNFHDNRAGWVSVLMNLKARADHGVDLRNHESRYSWANGYVDN